MQNSFAAPYQSARTVDIVIDSVRSTMTYRQTVRWQVRWQDRHAAIVGSSDRLTAPDQHGVPATPGPASTNGSEASMTSLYDMHCHLDFADNAKDVAAEVQDCDLTALCSTVVPSSYVAAVEEFKPWPHVQVALGLHPWWVAQDRISEVDIARFESLAPTTPFIGEIGLDFHSKRRETKDRQEEVLYRLLSALNDAEDQKVIFLHGVRAGDELLNMLDRCQTTDKHICVFHWFQGTPDDFGRALSQDCWFSVGMRMLATEAGRMFAKAVPSDRLVIETDNPPHEGMPWSIDLWTEELRNTISDLAELREEPLEDLQVRLATNSEALLAARLQPQFASAVNLTA